MNRNGKTVESTDQEIPKSNTIHRTQKASLKMGYTYSLYDEKALQIRQFFMILYINESRVLIIIIIPFDIVHRIMIHTVCKNRASGSSDVMHILMMRNSVKERSSYWSSIIRDFDFSPSYFSLTT